MKKIIGYLTVALFMTTLLSFEGQAQVIRKKTVTYTLQTPENLKKGEHFNIDVILNIEPGWYIYAPTGSNSAQGMIETNVTFHLPPEVQRAGKIKIPEPIIKNSYEVLEGSTIKIEQPLKAQKIGTFAIRGRITYQTCSTDVCMPPVTEEFTTTVVIN